MKFSGAKAWGAVNLRGTGYAARDWTVHNLTVTIDGRLVLAQVRFAALAGYLVAKAHALRNRRLDKDMYDFAYVLIHNDAGGPASAADQVDARFRNDLPFLQNVFREVGARFSSPTDTGPAAYARLALDSEPQEDSARLAADAYAAVAEFLGRLYPYPE